MSLATPYPSEAWTPVRVHADDPALVAVAAILRRLLHVMRDNEAAMIEDVHPNHLHDFRVAVRRSRAILGCTRGVFKKRATRALQDELRWLSVVTGAVRDTDVFAMRLAASERAPGVVAANTARRDRARDALLQAVASRRYPAVLRQFEELLEGPAGRRGERSARDLARSTTRRAWRKVTRNGRAIDSLSSDHQLHELRKRCKKLRYLVEAFGSLFPADEAAEFVVCLRLVQDALGIHQDCVVQRAVLEELAVAGARTGEVDTLLASSIALQDQCRADLAVRFGDFDAPRMHALAEQLFGATPRE